MQRSSSEFPARTAGPDRGPVPAVAAVAGVLLLAVGLFMLVQLVSRGTTPSSANGDVHAALDAAARDVAAARRDSHEARARARAEYEAFLTSRLETHERRLDVAREHLRADIVAFFDSRAERLPAFADAALTWRNRFQAAWDSEKYADTLKDLFAEKVVSADGLAEEVGRDVELFLRTVAVEEKSLLQDVRVKIRSLPALGVTVDLDEHAFRRMIRKRIDAMAGTITTSSRVEFAGAVGIAAGVAALVNNPVGTISALSLTSIGAIGPAISTWIIVCVKDLFDQLVVTQSEVAETGRQILEQLHHALMAGGEEAWDDYRALEKIAKNDPDQELRERASRIMNRMRNRGYLGLTTLLDLIQERNMTLKTEVFHEIGAQP